MPISTAHQGSSKCSDAFRTVCPNCDLEAELSKVHLNKDISCARCTHIFAAEENVLGGKKQDNLTACVATPEFSESRTLGNDMNEMQSMIENTDAQTNAFQRIGCGLSPRKQDLETFSDEEIRFKRHHKPSKKRKKNAYADLFEYGVALSKAPRERKTVNRFSPVHQISSRKKARKVKGDQGSLQNGDAVHDENINGMKIAGSFVDMPDGLLKSMITQEIQKQVLDDFLARGMNVVPGIEVVDLENIYPTNETIPNKSYSEGTAQEERFIAKVKLMATLEFPISMQESEPTESLNMHVECCEQEPIHDIMQEVESTNPQAPTIIEQHNAQKEKEPEGKCVNETIDCAGIEDAQDTPGYNFTCNKSEERVVLEEPEVKCANEAVDYADLEDVPYTLYYNFECARSVERFADGQVWACYSDDGMPRQFLLIKKVVSMNPFKVHAVLLEPASTRPAELPICGQYKTSSTVIVVDDVVIFSHMVDYVKVDRGIIEIYPNEGQVWALYKMWARTGLEERQKSGYDIVFVTAVSNDRTVIAVPLMRYGYYKTVYVQQPDIGPITIPKEDLVRFSHQIPEFKLLGLKGWFELDPVAVPFCV